jgi:hypothetical protein
VEHTGEELASAASEPPPVFGGAWAGRDRPERIVTLGAALPVGRMLEGHGTLNYVRENGVAPGYSAADLYDLRAALRWTRQIDALNRGRKWALERFFARLDPLLADGVAVAVVPSHDPFRTDTPMRELARRLAEGHDRADATGCLVRTEKIRRITFGGPSYAGLHRHSIRVEDPERVAGRAVLLLDDIARSGASLRACRALLLEAGAATVQSLALGRVVTNTYGVAD